MLKNNGNIFWGRFGFSATKIQEILEIIKTVGWVDSKKN
jgi:hypothetical protein